MADAKLRDDRYYCGYCNTCELGPTGFCMRCKNVSYVPVDDEDELIDECDVYDYDYDYDDDDFDDYGY